MDKECSLNPISVVPPHSRKRISELPTGMESSILEISQVQAALASVTGSHLRSQQWQQWFSQIASSLEELFSQLSLESLDDVLIIEQRLNSRNRESSSERVQFLLPPPEYIYQISEEPQCTLGMMKTFLSRLGMVLDSIRKDIRHVNKGTEYAMMERETLWQKVIALNDFLRFTGIISVSFIVRPQRIFRSSLSVGQPRTILDSGSRATKTWLISSRERFPRGAFGTTIVGFKMCSFVLLCAEGRIVDREERILKENVVKLEWICLTVCVAPIGQINIVRRVIAKVREHCKVNPPRSFDEILNRLVEEANIEGDKIHWAEDRPYSFLVGGSLHHAPGCGMFLVKRIKKEDDPLFFESQNKENHSHLYKSFPTDFEASGGEESKEFFGRECIKSRLEEAERDYDRAGIAEIAKEYLAYACGIHRHSHGRATMVTIDERGFHILESANLIDDKHPEKGYGESQVDGFVPRGYPF